MLKEGTKNGKLGEFSVNASSIIGTRVFLQSTISPSISKTTPSSSVGTFMLNVCGCLVKDVIMLHVNILPLELGNKENHNQSVVYLFL